MKGQSYIIFALIFALIIAIFAVINVEPVQVNYMFGTGEAPLILVILISVLLGGLATASVGAVRYFKLKRENRSLKQKANQTTESESSSGYGKTHEESVDSNEDNENRNVT
ncbi:LapA family protein [Halobacillus sp. K22]|uniref:LapA family protein n=1 Tax=Halobacillus sp. K22 TaxID=3457431 RepID=UPI003FCCDE03